MQLIYAAFNLQMQLCPPSKTTLLQSAYPNRTDCPKLDADFRNPEIINIINFHEKKFQGYRFFREIQQHNGVLTF